MLDHLNTHISIRYARVMKFISATMSDVAGHINVQKRKGPVVEHRANPPQSPYSNPALVESTDHLNPAYMRPAKMGCCEVFSDRE